MFHVLIEEARYEIRVGFRLFSDGKNCVSLGNPTGIALLFPRGFRAIWFT